MHLYGRLDKECKVVVKCHRTKGHELRIVNWGKLSKAHLFRFPLGILLSSEIRLLLSSGYREATSHMRVLMTCFSGEKVVREFFLNLLFLKSLQLKILNRPRYHILG